MYFDQILDSYFKQNFKQFCLICGKNSNKISCNICKDLISNLKGDKLNKIIFIKDFKYWMQGENKFGEKIKSYGLYCLQRIMPINTQDILKYIKNINLIQENNLNYIIQIHTTTDIKFNIIIPKVKNKIENFISYQNLFLYPELEKLNVSVSN